MGRGVGQLYAAGADVLDPREHDLSSLVTGGPVSRYDQALEAEEAARQNDSFMDGSWAATAGRIGA